MSYINHRQAAVSERLERIYDAIHRGCRAQEAADEIITESMKPTCICDGRRHWVHWRGARLLRTRHKTNPYCKAHEESTNAKSLAGGRGADTTTQQTMSRTRKGRNPAVSPPATPASLIGAHDRR